MTTPFEMPDQRGVSRRNLMTSALAAGSLVAWAGSKADSANEQSDAKAASPVAGKRYQMKKSINQWAFPYPDKMSLEQCLRLAKDAGFDGIELNYDLDHDLSPKSGTKEYTAIR